MRHYEKRQKMREYDHLVKTTCDLCGTEAKDGRWASDIYEVNEVEVTVRQKDGHNYPEGGFGEEYVVDLCPTCFKERLIPWLQSEGASVEPLDWDY